MTKSQPSLLELWLADPEPGDVERSWIWVRSAEEDGWGSDWHLAGISTPGIFLWMGKVACHWAADLVGAVGTDTGPSGFVTPLVQWCRAGMDGPSGLVERADARAQEFYA